MKTINFFGRLNENEKLGLVFSLILYFFLCIILTYFYYQSLVSNLEKACQIIGFNFKRFEKSGYLNNLKTRLLLEKKRIKQGNDNIVSFNYEKSYLV